MPGSFGGKYQGPAGAVLAAKDAEVQALIKNVKGFKLHLERIMLCIDELSGTYRDLCGEVGGFYASDPYGVANDVVEGYKKVTDGMANLVPRKVNEILRTKVIKTCEEWMGKLEAVRAAQQGSDLQEAADRVKHYLEKLEKTTDQKSIRRNQDKLAAATAEYEKISRPIAREMDSHLVAQKTEYSKLVVRVMQFQQAYFKQAFNSCDLLAIMDCLRDLVESNAWEPGEAERLRKAEQHALNGGATRHESSEEEFDSSDEDIKTSAAPNRKDRSNPSVVAFNKLADDLEEMFWGGRTPRERDLTAMKDAMYELNSKLLGCPKSNRKELRARIDGLDLKWKQAVDVHMKLGLTQDQPLYTGGIQKQTPNNLMVPTQPQQQPQPVQGIEVSSLPVEHLDMLRNDPSLAPEFDQMYGDGAAAQVLGIAPRPVAAVEILPSEDHIQMLRNDPSLAPKFDNFYGPGAAERMLEQQGAPVSQPGSVIPPEHAEMLYTDPSLAEEFDRIYGDGASAQVLSQPRPEVIFNAPPEHVSKLRADPSLAGRFDGKYGAGAAQYYLGGEVAAQNPSVAAQPGLNMQAGTLMEGEINAARAEQAKQAAIAQYQQKRHEASPRSPESTPHLMDELLQPSPAQPQPAPPDTYDPASVPQENMLGCYDSLPVYPPPEGQQAPQPPAEPAPQEHVDMLLNDPSFAEQFDEVYGSGTSAYYLQNRQSFDMSTTDSSAGSPAVRASFDYGDQDSDDDILYSAPQTSTAPITPVSYTHLTLPTKRIV
eukprot:TRINITY_DN7899_c0_g1_i4.p1 TRINITY_DN7899_c0_g1~~TRINITY_DN7899_c0_g1_i4.p1  ORF type:complete len:766 (-),score=208.64 TRINITY_DN7899_c0_g1_i4:114-2411(-)